MWNKIYFPIADILVDEKLVGGLGNIIIAGCYFLISIFLFGDLWRNRKAGVNWLTILIGSLLVVCSVSYFLPKTITASENNLLLGQFLGNWVGLLPAIAFFILYQRYQLLLKSTPTIESQQELEQKLWETTEKLQQESQCLQEANANLEKLQLHLTQIERLTILGQLVSGIAHEINNPINFIYGNLPYLEEYTQGLLKVIDAYQESYPTNIDIEKAIEEADLNYVRSDFPYIIDSIKTGADRIRELVQNLRNFYRTDESQMRLADINLGIESSLLLLYNFSKNKVQIIKQLSELPPVECYINQINQVFLSLVAKAINVLLELENTSQDLKQKQIIISSKTIDNDYVAITITNLNVEFAPEVKEQLFEPVFNPKFLGIGTGLGLSISHRIITEVHHGKIYCQSKSGKGTIFTVELPISQMRKTQPREAA